MKFILSFMFLYLALCEKLVIDLTDDNLETYLKSQKMGFIKFFSPNCPHCQSIEPVYEESAKLAKHEGLEAVFTRIDGDKFPKIMEKYNIKEVPYIIWFNNVRDHILTYQGDTEMPSYFIEHIKLQMSFSTSQVTFDEWKNITETKTFNSSSNVLIFVGSPLENLERFTIVSNSAWNIELKHILYTNDTKFMNYYNIDKNYLMKQNYTATCFMFKVRSNLTHIDRFEQINLTDDDFELNSARNETNFLLFSKNAKIEAVLTLYSKEIVNVFEQDNERVIIQGIPTLTLAHDFALNSSQYVQAVSALKKVSLKYRKEVFFMYGTSRTKFTQIFTETFRLHRKEFPIMCLTSLGETSKQWIDKYRKKLNSEMSEESLVTVITEFLEDWKNKRLKQYISSEEIPSKPMDENGIYKLVGDTFQTGIETTGKDVLLMLCSDKIDLCVKFREIFTRVARKLKHNENIKFVEANPHENELDFNGYEMIPGIILFPDRENKLTKYEEYKGRLTTREIIKFLREKAVHPIKTEEVLPAENVLFKTEEINELKYIDLNQRGVVRELHEKLSDSEQKELYKFVEKDELNKEYVVLNSLLDIDVSNRKFNTATSHDKSKQEDL